MKPYSFCIRHVQGCEANSDAIVVCPENDVNVSLTGIQLRSSWSKIRQDQDLDNSSPISVLNLIGLQTPERKRNGCDPKLGNLGMEQKRDNASHIIRAHRQSQSDPALETPGFVERILCCRMNSVVCMRNDGCEVQLQSSLPTSERTSSHVPGIEPNECTPLKEKLEYCLGEPKGNSKEYVFPQNSLLDTDHTPITSPERIGNTLFGSDLCCGSSQTCWSKGDENMHVTRSKRPIQNTISVLLGRPHASDDWCSGWQAWAYFDMDNRSMQSTDLKEDVKQVLRNRAFDLNAKTNRIKTLKGDLCPFDVTPEKGLLRSLEFSKTRSFCVSDNPRRNETINAMSKATVMEESQNLASVWDSVQRCTDQTRLEDSPFVIRTRGLIDDDICYDSDPEEITRRRTRLDVNRRRMSTFLKQGTLDERLPRSKPASPMLHNFANANDDEIAKNLVQELLNERLTLTWHPCTSDSSNSRPIGVKAWIERGQQLKRSLIQPMLCWQHVSLSNSKDNLCDKSKKPYKVDLMNITRVLEVNKVDRRQYPLAPLNKCLLIHCLDQRMLFEAGSLEERDRLVLSLKLAVARLGSKIILSDGTVFDEFFSMGDGVPGEAPVWKNVSKSRRMPIRKLW